MLRVGVILSGSGVFDGSEIHESVLTLLAIDRSGAQAICMAPNKNQSEVINHLTKEVSRETRNVLVESARIARGDIRDIRDVRASDLDAVILPGGFGAVKNLSDFVWNGERCWVDGDVYRLLREMAADRKPIGAICISPAVVAKIFSAETPQLTVGTDEGTAAALTRLGARHSRANVNEIVVDEKLQIVTTPAYMLARRIGEAAEGIERLVGAVLRRAESRARQTADSAPASLAARRKGQPADSGLSRVVTRGRKAQPADSAAARIVSRSRSRATAVTARKTGKSSQRRRTVRA